MLRVSNPTT